MSKIHIKPCPFCGSENISFNAFSISSDAYVLCEQCNASIEISVPWDDMDEKEHDKVCFEKLSVLWNKRASERNQPELNENQQKYLELLKRAYEKFGNVYDGIFFSLVDYEKRYGLPAREFFQVLDSLKVWVLEQEEAE